MRKVWHKLLIEWKLLILFAIMIVLPMGITLAVVQSIIVNQLEVRQQEKITAAKNAVASVLENSRKKAVNYMTLFIRDDAIRDSFYYAVKAREISNLQSEFFDLSFLMDFDLIIARDFMGQSLFEHGDVPEEKLSTPLSCSDAPESPNDVCDDLWLWGDKLLHGAIAPVYKTRLIVPLTVEDMKRDFLGTLFVANSLDDIFAKKVRDMTGAEIVIRNKDVIYAASRSDFRKRAFNLSTANKEERGAVMTQKVAGRSYLTTSIPISTKTGVKLGELIILADNEMIVDTTNRIYYTIYAVSGSIFLLAIVLASTFAREIGMSIRTLREGAEKIGRGDFSGKIEVGSHVELEILARSLNSMAENLKLLMAEKENYLHEIKEQHEKIIEQKESLASLFENANDLIYVADLNGKLTFINQKIEEYGFKKDDLIGKSMHDFITFRGWGGSAARTDGKKHQVCEVELNPVNGKQRVMIFSSSPLRDANQKIINELCILRDITDQKTLEEHITHSDRLACVGRLAAGLAHEVGNPLTSISSFMQMLLKKKYDPFTEDCIKTISKHISRIHLTVDKLKNLSRPTALEKWSYVDINETIQSAIKIVHYDPKLRGININTYNPGKLPEVKLQDGQIMQVIINLVLNAADALGNKGTINIKTQLEQNNGSSYVVIDIIDSGEGIAEEYMNQIFDPFFTTKNDKNGTGLGLYVSQCILQNLGGSIKVVSKFNEGSVFSLHIPLNPHTSEIHLN